jgi:class 3 adenylate cyclase/tetratricopeptide (TPR) repeat protein
MKCSGCGTENRAGRRFCSECGGPLAVPCPGCGFANEAGEKFCGGCGVALAAAPPPSIAPAPASPPTPARGEPPVVSAPVTEAATAAVTAQAVYRDAAPATYTPKHLAEKILSSRGAIQGERKNVTVMFVDVCGFTTISEKLDAEDVHGIMDRAFDVMMEAVHRYEGTINQFLGDGIMALFGAPIAHEDHPNRALGAALGIRNGLKPLQEDVRRTHGVEFRVRMGINTGTVVVGAIGRDLRMDYTAVGDTTNLTARLMSLAQPGQIVVSRQTQHLCERFFRWEDLGEFQVKGKSQPVRAYALLDEIRGQTRLEVSKERGLTPLVGREREIATLVGVYRRAVEGNGGVALVSGEPGVGKSRLLHEFLTVVESAGVFPLEASCVAYGRAIPYRPILDLVRSHLGLLEEMTADEIRWRAAKALLAVGIEDEDSAIVLGHFLGAPAPDAFLQRLAGAQLKERTFAVLRELLVRASEPATLVLVVENIHWIDPASEDFLIHLAAHVPKHRLVLLLTTRPGAGTSALAERAEPKLALGGLDPADLGRMVARLTGAQTVAEDLFGILMEKSAGNPLYVEEIIRQLHETDGVAIVDGEVRLRSADVTVPETIHDIIAARIDRVADELKRVLQGAAVIGRRFGVSLLSRVLGGPAEPIRQHLVDLHRLDFIFPAAEDPELMYSFKHALTQDVVYSSVLERRRREYHVAAATGLEELYPVNREPVVELIAYHFRRGQVWDKAASYLRQAAVKAQARWAHREAVTSLEAALEALGHLPETSETKVQGIDVRLALRGSLYPLGEFDKMLTYLRDAEAMAGAVSDERRLALVCIHTAEYLRQTGRFADARTLAEKALALGERLEDVPLQSYAGQYFGLACHALGEFRRASELLRIVTQASQPEGWRGALGMVASWDAHQAITLAWLARCLAELGEFDEGVSAGRRAVELAKGLDHPYSLTAACMGLGYIELVKGDLDTAGPVLERACRIAVEANLRLLRPQATRLLGNVYLLAGRIDEGVALVRAAADEVESRRLLMQQAAVLALLGEAWMCAGRLDEASATAQRALDLATERGQRGDAAAALHVLAEAAARDPAATDEAEHRYLAAIALAEELEMRPLLARAHLGTGRLYLRAGDHHRAEDHLLTATGLFIAMDMPFWLGQALSTLQNLGRVLIVGREHPDIHECLSRALPPEGPMRVVLSGETAASEERGEHVDAMLRSHGLSIAGE